MDDVCPICVENIVDCSHICELPDCSHVFCRNCLRTWAKTHYTCPVCSKEFFHFSWYNSDRTDEGSDDVFRDLYKGEQPKIDNIADLDMSVIYNGLFWIIDVANRLFNYLKSRRQTEEMEIVDELRNQANEILAELHDDCTESEKEDFMVRTHSLTSLLGSVRAQALNAFCGDSRSGNGAPADSFQRGKVYAEGDDVSSSEDEYHVVDDFEHDKRLDKRNSRTVSHTSNKKKSQVNVNKK
eukprot:GDKJ01028109.1.p1 GENE.GDKJ01028109.1~~GDKJ01028109.1.p1  ORF type:complete len:240 (+),score=31.28 GDKJ01028109.1:11-730(+)